MPYVRQQVYLEKRGVVHIPAIPGAPKEQIKVNGIWYVFQGVRAGIPVYFLRD